MSFGNIVNKFHDKYSLPYTSTTKQPDFSSSLVWCKKVHHLAFIKKVKSVLHAE